MTQKAAKRIGILTAGSDSPGLNAAIRAIGKTLQGAYGMEIVGFQDGFRGLVEDRTLSLEGNALSNILTAGGTLLGTSRDLPERYPQGDKFTDQSAKAVETYQRHHLQGLICIGGRETQESAARLARQGLSVITLPKAIDNDVSRTDRTIGFDTAVEVAAESIDRLHSTAHSLHRIVIVELMGRNTGWLTLGAGISSGADVILIPEIPYDILKVAEAVQKRGRAGKSFSIVAVSERVTSQEDVAFRERLRLINAQRRSGEEKEAVDAELTDPQNWNSDSTFHIANRLRDLTELETRVTILGYLLRGGAPTAADRILATQLGTAAAELAYRGRFGVMLGILDGRIVPSPLGEVGAGHKPIPLDHPWLDTARSVGTNLGN